MGQKVLSCGVIGAALLLGACGSVPTWESRLRGIQFHNNMYVAQAGDTFETIALRYQLPIAELRGLNPNVGNTLIAGTRLNVRPGTTLAEEVRSRAVFGNTEASRPAIARRPTDDADVVISATSLQPQLIGQPLAAADQTSELSTGIYPNEASDVREEIVSDSEFSEAVAINSDDQLLQDELRAMVESWHWPTQGQIARGYNPDKPNGQGVDIAGVPGQDIHAAAAGTVVYSGRDLSGGGNLIIVRHPENLLTTYSHADNLFVAEDDEVQAGDPIASLGWNAAAESVLRFEVRRDGKALDPMDFLPAP